MSTHIAELDQRMENLKEMHDLTDKQAAILASFDEDPGATYGEVTDRALNLLDQDATLSTEYARAVVTNNRPSYFGEQGRLKPQDLSEDEEIDARASVLQGWYGVNEARAYSLAQAEREAGITLTGREDLESTEPEPAPEERQMEAEEGVPPQEGTPQQEPAPQQEGGQPPAATRTPTREEVTGEQEIVLPHTTWIGMVGYLQMFAQSEAGAYFREDLEDLSADIEEQLP